jgi:hypothetical protein
MDRVARAFRKRQPVKGACMGWKSRQVGGSPLQNSIVGDMRAIARQPIPDLSILSAGGKYPGNRFQASERLTFVEII